MEMLFYSAKLRSGSLNLNFLCILNGLFRSVMLYCLSFTHCLYGSFSFFSNCGKSIPLCSSSVVCNLAFMSLGMNILFYNYFKILDCFTDIPYVYLLI